MATKEYLRLEFVTDNLRSTGININYPKKEEDITEEQIKQAMENICTKKVMQNSQGLFVTPKSATRVVTTKTDIDIE